MKGKGHLRQIFTALILVGVLALPLSPPAHATGTPPLSDSVYGMDILGAGWQVSFPRLDAQPAWTGALRLDLLDAAFRLAAEAGVRQNRLAVWWCKIELRQDQWYWDDVDAVVQIASNYGIETMPVLMFTPSWAAGGAYAPECGAGTRRNYPPNNWADWEDFVRTIVRRYGPAGQNAARYWEIWNEPDLWEFLITNPPGGDTVPVYAELLQRAARVIRVEAPGARVLLGGLSDIHGASYLDALLTLTGSRDIRQSFDILAFHAYSDHLRRINALRSVMNAHGLGQRLLWDTELNNWGWDYAAAQAGLPALYQQLRGAGVTRTFWYKGFTSDFGLGIFDPLPAPVVTNPFYQTFKAQAAPFRLPGRPVPLEPGAVVRKTRPVFTWQAAPAGDYPVAGYKLQIDNRLFLNAPRFARPELDAWVSAGLPGNYLPLVMQGRPSSQAAGRGQANGTDQPTAPTAALRGNTLLTYEPAAPLTWGTHYWRVAAVDIRGNVGPYSEPRPLLVQMPFASHLPLISAR